MGVSKRYALTGHHSIRAIPLLRGVGLTTGCLALSATEMRWAGIEREPSFENEPHA